MTTTVHMEKSARMIAALAAVFCAASLSAATTYIVASDESLTLDASSNNQAGNQITLEDGATLVLTGDKVDKYKAVVTCDGGIISVKLRLVRGLTLTLR